ncbi:MAG: hypothetical protein LBJ00_07315 [Planctomycetaceae bacterium]|nr:hypothetical protein [Planctomycetaceae bacterium]
MYHQTRLRQEGYTEAIPEPVWAVGFALEKPLTLLRLPNALRCRFTAAP